MIDTRIEMLIAVIKALTEKIAAAKTDIRAPADGQVTYVLLLTDPDTPLHKGQVLIEIAGQAEEEDTASGNGSESN